MAAAAAAASTGRGVRVVAGARIAPPVYRCLGTVDIDGNGTDCDITHAGPFILGDVVTMAKMDMFRAPFCAHPHSGATVCSVLMEGKPFRAWDNVRGAEAELLLPGGVYMLDSGYGCVHDEKPDPISLAPVTRAVFAEGESAIGEGFSFLQLWFNPGNLHQLDSKPMSSQVLSPSEVPVITDGPLSLRLLAGKHGGAESPLALPHELVLMHGRLQGGNKSSLQLPPGHEGFIVLVKDSGAALVAGQALEHGHTGCIIGGEDAPLELQAASEAPVFFVLGVGVPHETSGAKLLGYGGALFEDTAEAARAKMEVYAADPQNFGRAVQKAELPDLAADLACYKMVEGYQNKGDGLNPGKAARWSPADAAAM